MKLGLCVLSKPGEIATSIAKRDVQTDSDGARQRFALDTLAHLELLVHATAHVGTVEVLDATASVERLDSSSSGGGGFVFTTG